MMRIFDTHCHLCDPAFADDLPDVLARMQDAGVTRANVVADPAEEEPNQERVFSLVAQNPGFLCASIGVHPHNAVRWSEDVERTLKTYLAREDCRLLGEIGLDYHYDLSPRDVQRAVFARQLDIAYAAAIPVQLHIREAHEDALDILQAAADAHRLPCGILHCCTTGWADVARYLDFGFYISLSGAVTFKKAAALNEVCKNLPPERMLIETDCPYMAPVPLRGRRNEPAYIVHTLACVSALRELAPERMAQILFENAERVFARKNSR